MGPGHREPGISSGVSGRLERGAAAHVDADGRSRPAVERFRFHFHARLPEAAGKALDDAETTFRPTRELYEH